MLKLKNHYYLLRHGRNIHQTDKKHICYNWPDDNPPCKLDEVGIKQAKQAGIELKDKNIELIFSSDILRTKQTAEIVASILDKEITSFDERLRDNNWGIFAGKLKAEARAFYNDKDKMIIAPPQGESWGDIQKRLIDFISEIEKKYTDKNVLIVSHGDPILLIEAWINEWNLEKILEEKQHMIGTGEIKKLN